MIASTRFPPPPEDARALEEGTLFTPRFGENGLIGCMTVHAETAAPLMFAWMNAQALHLTLQTGFAHYWSRSREAIWKKGETSGALQQVVEMRTDCDQDALLLRVIVARTVDANGTNREATCHTGRAGCFYRKVVIPPAPSSSPLLPVPPVPPAPDSTDTPSNSAPTSLSPSPSPSASPGYRLALI